MIIVIISTTISSFSLSSSSLSSHHFEFGPSHRPALPLGSNQQPSSNSVMALRYVRMPIEAESPEEQGYDTILFNLSESSMRDRSLSDVIPSTESLSGIVLAYGPHRGAPSLRAAIAEAAGGGLTADHVLTAPGAAGALFTIATTLLSRDDHLIVLRPNYATNIGAFTRMVSVSAYMLFYQPQFGSGL